ncbi:PAS domain-containing protein [Spirosoma sp. HMF4905]|uniref:PAS domain-containing protein n=1 Tax=Spirosoma arboris TaxID=2682092 RepID=A0A7K1SAH4_9BACT|nr:PAS domain-containing protein [Spirosoma arboris]MVM30807.1 PAS domain-containing protein [Spirosoma arboris]
MDFCGPYDKYLAEHHREFLHAPLLAGWEFMQRVPLTTEESGWMSLAKAQDWKLPASIRHELLSDKWAIVITDIDQIIQYVNLPFEEMTGYSSQEVLGRRPGFLQGEGTSQRIRQHIKQGIDRQKSVRGRLMNYRKDQTPYVCQLIIRPIVNRQKQVVNFIAFEQEVGSNGKSIVR